MHSLQIYKDINCRQNYTILDKMHHTSPRDDAFDDQQTNNNKYIIISHSLMSQTKLSMVVTINAENSAEIGESFLMVTCFSEQHSTGTVPQSSERGLTSSTGPTPSHATVTICTLTTHHTPPVPSVHSQPVTHHLYHLYIHNPSHTTCTICTFTTHHTCLLYTSPSPRD